MILWTLARAMVWCWQLTNNIDYGRGQCSQCDNYAYSKGFCRSHYDRQRRAPHLGISPIRSWGTVPGTCEAPGCDAVGKLRRGYCAKHYDRFRKYGNPLGTARRTTAEQERQWLITNSVVTEAGCWEWQRARMGAGYGNTRYQGKTINTHRLSYMLFVGPIPEGMYVLHKCDNPPCVNPEHLWLGTPADNMRDRDAKGRDRFSRARGESND